ncbi:Actin-related protein 5 [Linum perenne]
MPFISQIQRQSDYSLFSSDTPIVIDNGASYFRIGWAGETEPRIIFRNIVQRPRHKATGDCLYYSNRLENFVIVGETVTIVGDHDPALLRYFDCTRSGPRSAFENNVVFQFEIMEYILDFAFDRLGANGSQIDHPVLITECVCNPVHSRSKMAELLFETYGVPSVAFGVDAAFSYKYNQQKGVCNQDGLAICPGFNTTHVIPFIAGEPLYKGCSRTNIGGYHVTDYLKQLLSLKYPHHLARFTWEKVEDLKMEHCYIASNYASEAQLFQAIDPTFVPKSEAGASQPASDAPKLRPLTQEDFKIVFGVERFRCPEILFNPNLVGIDQAGVDEMAGVSIRRLPDKDEDLEQKLTSSILMTGGSCLYPGMCERLEAGIRMIRPCGAPIKVVRALDPILDAWRGASAYASAVKFPQQTFTRMDYLEKGEDWLRGYKFRYTL